MESLSSVWIQIIELPSSLQRTAGGGLSSTLEIFTAMLTPAVLILVSGSLTLATSQRLNRVIERARKLYDQQKEFGGEQDTTDAEDRKLLLYLLRKNARRARHLQRAMSSFYMALALFVLTSVIIGILDIAGLHFAWFALLLGMAGAVFLLHGTLHLLAETHLALVAVRREMSHVVRKLEEREV